MPAVSLVGCLKGPCIGASGATVSKRERLSSKCFCFRGSLPGVFGTCSLVGSFSGVFSRLDITTSSFKGDGLGAGPLFLENSRRRALFLSEAEVDLDGFVVRPAATGSRSSKSMSSGLAGRTAAGVTMGVGRYVSGVGGLFDPCYPGGAGAIGRKTCCGPVEGRPSTGCCVAIDWWIGAVDVCWCLGLTRMYCPVPAWR